MLISRNKWMIYIQNHELMSDASKKLSLNLASTDKLNKLVFTDSPIFTLNNKTCLVKTYRVGSFLELVESITHRDGGCMFHAHELILPDGTLQFGIRIYHHD